jgi:dipeptidase D
MSGASQLSKDFLKGRKVINLDSEDYDTTTTGAAGACLQFHRIPINRETSGEGRWLRIRIEEGLGGHSGVDINKGRCSAAIPMRCIVKALCHRCDISGIEIGEANASIASKGEVVICVTSDEVFEFVKQQVEGINQWMREEYPQDPSITCSVEECEVQETVIPTKAIEALVNCLEQVPQGVVKMSETMPGTVETSNNIGRIVTEEKHIFVSTHTRSFIDNDMAVLSETIAKTFTAVGGATSEVVMSAPAWQEVQQSPFLQLVSNTFQDVLGWQPRMVAMHFVLEAGFFVQHYPGIQIASIGPRIVEPHSTSERVELKTIDDIWRVLIELLRRLA